MIVRTKKKSGSKGQPQIIAIGGGRQKTSNVDLSRSNDANHGLAAGALLLVHGWTPEVLDDHTAEHDMSDDGNQHGFCLTHKASE